MDDCFESCADSFGQMSSGKRCGCISFCLGFVAIIVYIAVAIEGVEPIEYALIRNNINQDIDQVDILSGGLHWVGLFSSLIHFPSIHKSIEFSDDAAAQEKALSTRTKEGLELHLHFAFQYVLRKQELPAMYRLLQEDYEKIFTRIARNAVLSIAGDYNAPDYWLERDNIGKSMLESLVTELNKAHADVSGFMLLKIDLPDLYEGAIVKTQVTTQQRFTYEIVRTVNETAQSTVNIQARGYAEINVINSQASANATQSLNKGAGLVAQQNIQYVGEGLAYVSEKLAFTDPKNSLIEYFQYQRINALKDDTKNKLLVGVTATLIQND